MNNGDIFLSSIHYGMTLKDGALNMEICHQFIVISDKGNNWEDWASE